MSADRLHGNELVITQEMIANLPGVSRPSLTPGLGLLQTDGLMSTSRGHITVVDRPGLEKRVCECYAALKEEYERLIPGGLHSK